MSTFLFLLIRSIQILRSSAYSFVVHCSPLWLINVCIMSRLRYQDLYAKHFNLQMATNILCQKVEISGTLLKGDFCGLFLARASK